MNHIPVLDTQKFWENFSDLKHLVPALMDTFEKQCPGSLARIEAAIKAGDAKALRSAAHAFKGCLYQIFATRSGKLAEELENLGRAGSVQGAEALYVELVKEVDVLLKDIRHLMPAQQAS